MNARGKSLLAILPTVQECMDEVRRIRSDLRLSILNDPGILPTLGWFCREFEEIYGKVRIEKEIDDQESDVPYALRLVIHRLMPEGVNNVATHR